MARFTSHEKFLCQVNSNLRVHNADIQQRDRLDSYPRNVKGFFLARSFGL